MDSKKLLRSLVKFYESRASAPDPVVEQDLSFIRQDLESDLLLSASNIADSLGRISVHKAIIGVGALLRNDRNGWASIHKAMLYSFWAIRLTERSLQQAISINPNRNLPELGVEFSEAASLLLYCIYHEQREMAGTAANVLKRIFTNPRYLNREIMERSVYERFALNLYHAQYVAGESIYLKSTRPSVYDGLDKRLFTEDFGESDVILLCDYHCDNVEDTGDWRPEFCTPPFDILPIEILTIFKLRHKAGLENPKTNHPLLNPVFMNMPVAQFENDPVIDEVEEKYIETFGFSE